MMNKKIDLSVPEFAVERKLLEAFRYASATNYHLISTDDLMVTVVEDPSSRKFRYGVKTHLRGSSTICEVGSGETILDAILAALNVCTDDIRELREYKVTEAQRLEGGELRGHRA